MEQVSVIIAAAGNAVRMQGKEKQWVCIGGKPVIMHSILVFDKIKAVKEIVVVVRKQDVSRMKACVDEYSISTPVFITDGGNCRQESVANGFEACSADSGFIAVHDGARPFVCEANIIDLFSMAYRYGAAALGVPVKETLKQVDREGMITRTPDRDFLWAAQTPQIFSRSNYEKALLYAKQTGREFTDDCQLMEAMQIPVKMVHGSYSNLKITTPDDLAVAAVLLQNREVKQGGTENENRTRV